MTHWHGAISSSPRHFSASRLQRPSRPPPGVKHSLRQNSLRTGRPPASGGRRKQNPLAESGGGSKNMEAPKWTKPWEVAWAHTCGLPGGLILTHTQMNRCCESSCQAVSARLMFKFLCLREPIATGGICLFCSVDLINLSKWKTCSHCWT